jgi:hypothetical protein
VNRLIIYFLVINYLTIALAGQDDEIIENIDFYIKMEYLEFEEKYGANEYEYSAEDKKDKKIVSAEEERGN